MHDHQLRLIMDGDNDIKCSTNDPCEEEINENISTSEIIDRFQEVIELLKWQRKT